jgi:hypothetical protein
MEYLIYMAIGVIAYLAGRHAARVELMLNISKDPDKFIRMLNQVKELNEIIEDDSMPEEAVPCEAETVNGVVYLYDKITGEFLAQGNNLVQAITTAATRFPGKTFWHPELDKDRQTT